MGDSDDDVGPRREKFQRERDPRGEQYERRGGRDRDWNHRERSRGWGGQSGGGIQHGGDMKRGGMHNSSNDARRRPVDYPPPMEVKRRYSPDHDADMRGRKRMRGGYEQHYDAPPWSSPPWGIPIRQPYDPRSSDYPGGGPGPGAPAPNMVNEVKSNQMMTFKQWLNTQNDDDINEEEAIANYNKYKINHRQQQLQEFFVAHKSEEWFKEKYHPDVSQKRFTDQRASVKWRLEVFHKMEKLGMFKKVKLDLENDKEIIKLMDAAVIFMEGGTEEDLKILELEEEEEVNKAAEEGDVKSASDATDVKIKKELDDGESKDNASNDDTPPGLEKKDDNDIADDKQKHTAKAGNDDENVKPEEEGEVKKGARALHRTHSIFMRNLPPKITKQEIINLCKEYPGFIRVAFSNQQDQNQKLKANYARRCWVTFNRGVNIKDVCWKLNKIRVRDAELSPVVNRDLNRRVRAVSGISQHTSCARNDLRNIARLIAHLDQKWKMWEHSEDEGEKVENPLLKDIADYLVDEVDADEALLGSGEDGSDEKNEEEEKKLEITRDDQLITVLDTLLYYLRIVHSVDYYNASEYFCEDEMPNRCGIVHARGPVPPNMLTKKDVDEFQKRFSQKLAQILEFKGKLTEEEAQKLGPKDEESEIEKFVSSNAQELEQDKWLCPLSGKKFKSKEYVRKHIFNKHKEKVDDVRNEVKYFNNYLMDPRRPFPDNNQRTSGSGGSNQQQGGPRGMMQSPQYGMPMAGRGYPPPPAGMGGNYRGPHNFQSPQFQRPPNPYTNARSFPPRNREMRHNNDNYRSRKHVAYQDLDAPEEEDFF